MSTIFDVLAEPNRRRILDLLRSGERSVNELVAALGLSQPAVSKHLRILKEAGLVEAHPDAQRRLYSLRTQPLIELDTWLTSYRSLWEQKFDRLDDYLRTLQAQNPQPAIPLSPPPATPAVPHSAPPQAPAEEPKKEQNP